MSRRKQSHPRAWKDTTDSIQQADTPEASHPEIPDHIQNGSSGAAEAAGIPGRTDPEQLSSSQVHDAILKAQVGQTLGPVSASICSASEEPRPPQAQSEDGTPQLLKMVLDAPNDTTETLEFSSVREDEQPHLEMMERGDGVYIKLLRTVEAGTNIRGLVLHQPREEGREMEMKQEPPEYDPGLCCSIRGPTISGSGAATEYPTMGTPAERGSPDTHRIPAAGESPAAHGRPTARRSPTAHGSPMARGSPGTHGSPTPRDIPTTRRSPTARGNHTNRRSPCSRESPQPQADMTPSEEGEISNVATKKCPNCSVCFRNSSNLEAHQQYYCTGRHQMNSAPDISGTSPQVLPRNPSRSPSPVHVCQLCQSSFMSRQNCESHMLILHCSEHVPMCKFCNFVAPSWDILREHVFTHVKMEKQNRDGGDERRSRLIPVDVDVRINLNKNCSPPASTLARMETEAKLVSSEEHPLGRNGEVETGSSRSPPDARHPNIPHPDCLAKRKLRDLTDVGAKRARLLEAAPPTSSSEEGGGSPTHQPKASSGGYPPAAYMCRSCSICFRSKENYMAHKRYYCKQRLTQGESWQSNSSSQEGSPDYSSQTMVAPERGRSGQSKITCGDISGTSSGGSESRRITEPHPAPMMYMSPVLPSAMLVGGTQHITPSGAHVISPIFLLTPPMAIPMPRMEPPDSSPHSPPHSPEVTEKGRDKGDAPLDLRLRASSEHPRSPPLIIKKEPSDTTSTEEAHSSKKSPTKGFTCVRCGTHFQKASTLMAHEQLYCSELDITEVSPPTPLRTVHGPRPATSIHNGSPSSSVAALPAIPSSEGGTSSLEHQCKSFVGNLKSPRTKLKHPEYHRSRLLCDVNDYLERIYSRNCPEKQLMEGLRVCTGCGVAFRKLESLQIHQQFYCQKASSVHPAYRGPSASMSRSPPLEQAHSPPMRGVHSPPIGQLNVPPMEQLHSHPRGQSTSPSMGQERGEANHGLPREGSVMHEPRKREQDYTRGSAREHPEMSETLVTSSDQHGSADERLPCTESQVDNEQRTGDGSSETAEHERVDRQKELDGQRRTRAEHERTASSAERSSPHHEREELSPARGNKSDMAPQSSSPVQGACDADIHTKEGLVSEHDGSQRDAGLATRQSSPAEGIRIKMEPTSPENSTSPPELAKRPPMNVKLASPVNRVSPSSTSGNRSTPSGFPPGSKACKSCNISFRSLSTFIAHKNFYCSSTKNLRSNVAS